MRLTSHCLKCLIQKQAVVTIFPIVNCHLDCRSIVVDFLEDAECITENVVFVDIAPRCHSLGNQPLNVGWKCIDHRVQGNRASAGWFDYCVGEQEGKASRHGAWCFLAFQQEGRTNVCCFRW